MLHVSKAYKMYRKETHMYCDVTCQIQTYFGKIRLCYGMSVTLVFLCYFI